MTLLLPKDDPRHRSFNPEEGHGSRYFGVSQGTHHAEKMRRYGDGAGPASRSSGGCPTSVGALPASQCSARLRTSAPVRRRDLGFSGKKNPAQVHMRGNVVASRLPYRYLGEKSKPPASMEHSAGKLCSGVW
jgi:hypothetical protein